MARIAIMALEGMEEEVEKDTRAPEEAAVDTIADSPEQDVTEMTEEADTATDIDDAVVESEEVSDALTDIATEMRASMLAGGMDEHSAKAISLAVEHMCKRIGFPTHRCGFALEGFSKKETRVQATKIAMESAMDKVKAIGKTIMEAIRKVIEAVQKFFANLFNAAKKNKSRAETIIAAANKAKSLAPKQIKGNKLLVRGGKFIAPDKLASTLQENHNLLNNGVLRSLSDVNTFKKVINLAVDSLKNVDIEKINDNITEYNKIVESQFAWGDRKEEDGGVEFTSKAAFIGDKNYVVKASGKFFKLDKFGFENTKDFKEVADAEVTNLTSEQAIAVCENIIVIMDDFLEKEKTIKDLKDASFSFLSSLKTGYDTDKTLHDKGTGETDSGNIATTLTAVITSVNSVVRFTNISLTKIRSYEMSVAGAALSYAASSISGGSDK